MSASRIQIPSICGPHAAQATMAEYDVNYFLPCSSLLFAYGYAVWWYLGGWN